jgi:hypothetical protein
LHAAARGLGIVGREARRFEQAAVGQGAIGVDQFLQTHIQAAQGQGITVEIGGFGEALEAEPGQSRGEGFQAGELERAHRRDVEGTGQGRAQADQAAMGVVVVPRRVFPGAGGDGQGGILQGRGGREQAVFQGQAVEEGLQGGAGLARRLDAVAVGRGGFGGAEAGVGEDFATGVVHHQGGGILDVARGQVGELFLQGGEHEALEIGIEGGGDASPIGEGGHQAPPFCKGGK